MNKIAILITCFNRKDKTIKCLTSLYKALDLYTAEMKFDVFLVDDGCTDGTSNAIKELFPTVNIICGSGQLFWSGGMRLAWKTALMKDIKFDAFLLLNDDVILNEDFFSSLLVSHEFCLKKYSQSGIYVSSTKDMASSKISYGGTLITRRGIRIKSNLVKPSDTPIVCTMANANILMVTKSVVDKIGILDERYNHQFADFDYTFVASKKRIPVLVCPGFGGYCDDDHGKDWVGPGSSLKKRINFLYNPLGLSYKDQIYYLKKNFKFQFPYYFLMLWLKTFFPFVWEKYKK